MINIVSVDIMRKSDYKTIEAGTPSLELMRRAALSIYKSHKYEDKIAIISGNGNNGGDGLSLAEVMLENDIKPDVFLVSAKLSDNAKYYYNRLQQYNINCKVIDADTDLNDYSIIVDCIFGTGLAREVKGVYREIIEKINNSDSYVISADIPSGINGDNGRVMGTAIRADKTVAIESYKAGHFLNDASDYCGELKCNSIGIDVVESYCKLVEEKDIAPIFPKRDNNINKGSSGKLLIIGGSEMYMGAILLAESGAAALRVGAGLSTLAIPNSFVNAIISRIETSTIYPLKDSDGYIAYDSESLERALSGATACVVGMGMGLKGDNVEILEHLLSKRIPLLIDADAINTLANNMELLKNKRADVILTPHPKEFSRLSGKSVNEILNNPIELAKEFAKKHKIILLLKGVCTIITDGSRVVLSNSGSPNMAKGGSGDVLSGVIGGLLARGQKAFESAWCSAYITGKAGEIAGEKYGYYSANPTDTVKCIVDVLKKY